MKALVLENYGSPFVIKEIERPVPKDGEVLVQIKAASVNPLDTKIKTGNAGHAKTKLPAILGIDMAGIVVEVGKDVKNFKAGDEVYGMTGGIAGVQGSLAEYAAVDADLLALKPKNLIMGKAAAIPLGFITAWEGLVDRAKIEKGKTVLIHGGTGGVGHMATQIAVAKGAKVFTTDSPAKKELAEAFGATSIDYTSSSIEDYMTKHTDGEGFDIVFDTVGGAVLDDSFKAAKTYHGHVVSILGWGTHSIAPLSFRGATYSGVFTLLPLITGKHRAHHGEILREATAIIEAGQLKPIIDPSHYTFENIEEAYQAVASGKAKGKVIINLG
ncbi:zinc-dependent alcohol dehydrogenase family protein [Mucilaginibacter sp. dw_454]|uniref:zinc-dependent alcohol dehydrogenase family protein n=1 Tax=Mucilaginibacter sp. dw_454 TaxID=2720079 RepID=UPI001BD468EB|nr:zinc-dependent alcohol dehydrogenase family protein [Mucilaginibacter sp. dw_454]